MSQFFIFLQISFVVLVASQSPTFHTVYILPPAGSTIYASCWSNSSSPDYGPQNFSHDGEFSWKIGVGYYDTFTTYWCRARMGSNIITQFPIYGDGLERDSSEWLINSRGSRRLSLNGNLTNDYRGKWVVT